MLEIFTPLIQTALVVIAGIVVKYLAKFLQTKTGVVLDESQQAQAKEFVLAMEEKGMAMLNGKIPGAKLPGYVKRANAISLMQKNNPEMTVDKATDHIDRAVGSLPDVGSYQPYKISTEIPKEAL